jgi:hypothetical protein
MTPLRRIDLEKLIAIYLVKKLSSVTPDNKAERKRKTREKEEKGRERGKGEHSQYTTAS